MSESFVISQGKYIQVFAVLVTRRYMTRCQTKDNQIQPPESEGGKHIISKRLLLILLFSLNRLWIDTL